ncbi:MAG: oxidoreductase [Cyanobacteriota bacterium]|nr:oxidoreductase [Cyanobacteriota bacterium]
MVWTADAIPSQEGRVALVTGANSGLGLATARALSARGATVVMACRSLRKAEAARSQLLEAGLTGLDLLELDLADLNSVQRAASELRDRYGHLDLLLNNAGVMAPPRTLTNQGHELQFGVNHLGHMALTLQLLPLMQSRHDARVVTVTSGAQYFGKIRWDDPSWSKGYDRYEAYGQSKLANVMFALELEARQQEQGSGIRSLAAHPGLARTDLQPTAIATGGNRLEALAYRLMDPLFQSATMGALPQLHAATAETAQGGEHYGPDQWGGMRGHPTRCRIAPAALDREQRQRLWQLSERLIGA